MLKIPAATAFACAILIFSSASEARSRLRLFSSAPKPAAAVTPKPTAVAPQHSGGLYVSVGSRTGAATYHGSARFSSDESAKGPLQFDPTLGPANEPPPADLANDKPPEPVKERAALPASEGAAAKEPAPTKENEKVRPNEYGIGDAVRSKAALVPIANKQSQAAALQPAVVCYVRRDGSCRPD